MARNKNNNIDKAMQALGDALKIEEIGQEIQDEFRFNKKIKFPLEPGVWKVAEKKGWFYGDIKIRFIGLALMDGNEIVAYREFQEGSMTGSFHR